MTERIVRAYHGLMRRPDYSSAVIGTGFGLGRWLLSRWAFLVVLWTLIVLIFHFPLIALAVFAVLAVAFYRTSGLYYRRHHRVSR